MTFDQVVGAVFDREGDAYAEPPAIDQPTGRGGITIAALAEYVRNTHAPLEVTVETLKTLTHEQAAKIVGWTLQTRLRQTGLNQIGFEPTRLFMLDFAYNSGTELAIRWLQRVLDVPRTGRMDPPTVAAILYPSIKRLNVFIHQALIAARAQMVTSAVDGGSINEKYEHGLDRRIDAFSLLQVP